MDNKSAVRINAYMSAEVADIFAKTKTAVDKRLPEPMSESQAIREAIRAWAKQEKIK